ncbi:hypothetical protein [Liberiplasma polymorphum]|uniref:hypothetical protein n=1 Tax=Liberiplasma polymorphum TaxID=3374570 RepID=UPI003775BFC0
MKHVTLKSPSSQKPKKTRLFKRMYASIAITGAVVGGIILFSPKSVIANIERLEIYSSSIYYEVYTVDEDNVLIQDSLVLILESEFDEIIIPLETGLQVGTISNLQPNTAYTLKIIANEGFGNKTLLTRTFTTRELTQVSLIWRRKYVW